MRGDTNYKGSDSSDACYFLCFGMNCKVKLVVYGKVGLLGIALINEFNKPQWFQAGCSYVQDFMLRRHLKFPAAFIKNPMLKRSILISVIQSNFVLCITFFLFLCFMGVRNPCLSEFLPLIRLFRIAMGQP